MSTYKEFLEEELKDPEVKAEYERLGPEFDDIQKSIRYKQHGLISRDLLCEEIGKMIKQARGEDDKDLADAFILTRNYIVKEVPEVPAIPVAWFDWMLEWVNQRNARDWAQDLLRVWVLWDETQEKWKEEEEAYMKKWMAEREEKRKKREEVERRMEEIRE